MHLISIIKSELANIFKMTDLGPVKRFLGIEITRHANGNISINQATYIGPILERFGLSNCNPVSTPLDPSVTLHQREDGELACNATEYREIVGSVMHPAIYTRPDICNSVSKLSKYNSNPSVIHMAAARHLLRYLQGTKYLSIIYTASRIPVPLSLYGHCDASWDGDFNNGKSTSGYAFYMNGLIAFASKLQSMVAQSSMESEYYAIGLAAKELLWLRQLLGELGIHGKPPPVYMINSDSQSAIAACKNPVHHARTKHIALRYHFIRDLVAKGLMAIGYISTDLNSADVLTKTLKRVKHATAIELFGMAKVE